ncbi:MAG: hypothetical protein RLT30_06605 [Gammaproteobacteria bacterium]
MTIPKPVFKDSSVPGCYVDKNRTKRSLSKSIKKKSILFMKLAGILQENHCTTAICKSSSGRKPKEIKRPVHYATVTLAAVDNYCTFSN